MHFEQQAEVLNDLVKINNDRVEGYKKAVDNLEADDAAFTAYNTALESDELTPTQREILLSQLQIIKLSHNEIKALRDAL